jgi:hypothetical protein
MLWRQGDPPNMDGPCCGDKGYPLNGILNILQPYRPPLPVTGIALLFFFTATAN